jgi:sugar phosphate isomerase/epimerase
MKLASQENLVPGDTLAERLAKMESYGFEGIEIWGKDLPGRVDEVVDALSTSATP